MKKSLSLLLACAILTLSGCTPPDDGEITTTTTTAPEASETATTTSAVTTAPAETTTPVTTEKPVSKELTLSELGIENMPKREFAFYDTAGVKLLKCYAYPSCTSVISDNSMEITKDMEFFVRESTTALLTGGEDCAIDENTYVDYRKFESPYEIEWGNPVVKFEKITEESVKEKSAELSYSIKNEFQVNAFIKNTDEGAEIIIDPAYMYNIPLFTSRKICRSYSINGITINADTIKLACTYGKDSQTVEGNDYVYATIYLNDFVCRYDTDDGYNNSAVISNIEIIDENTEYMIYNAVFSTDPDKDPEMSEIYEAVVKSFDTILTEETYGIRLIDMDFDEKPEVLVSKIAVENQKEIGFGTPVDVDIYRVKNGSLKYIDTLYHWHYITDMPANRLGVKRLDDGTRWWFGVSRVNRDGKDTGYEDTDYLYRLEGDKLIYKEVFSVVLTGEEYNEEEDRTYYEYAYYYMGKEIVPKITYDYEPYYDPDYDYEANGMEVPQPDYPYYSWNGIRATFGMWELAGFIRAEFCDDIEETYILYNDWLTDGDYYYEKTKVDVSERTAAYKIAYDIDQYYYGYYSPEKEEHTGYWFLGAYAKPVIYLYPEEKTEVSVEVEFAEGGEFTCTYPEYGEGWKVTAMPDGTLYDEDGNEYYCLYWEGDGKADFDMSKGFCVKGSDTADFLREKLLHIGLTAREANEFIIYWLPIMQENEYNVITFHIDDYIKSVPMTVTPAPDTVIRVFMTFAPSDEYIETTEQELPSYERNGFAVVEWGGGEAKLYQE